MNENSYDKIAAGGTDFDSEVTVANKSFEKRKKCDPKGIGKRTSRLFSDHKQVGKWHCHAGYQLSSGACYVF